VEPLGKVRDRSVGTSELLQNAASGGVRERGERGIEAGRRILNHAVQYLTQGLAACKGRPGAVERWMGRQAALLLYVLALVAVVVGVDVLFFRNRFWERLMANVGIVLVFAAFYLRFLKRP
jgi:hypothetical protein